MIRFLHTSDLHLGKPFGRLPEDVRGRLRQARADVIARLAAAARAGGTGIVLVAGDTFDAETPAPRTLRQALNAMAAEAGITWYLLPGNHDSLAADELWREVAARQVPNVVPLLRSDPLRIAPGVHLMPAPPTARRPGRDLTEALDRPTPEGDLRIGLAHGAVTSFDTSEDGGAAVIPPDRDRRSGLDYLALGDWHGQIRVSPRTWYPGTPETDGFKHEGRGRALLVEIAGPGAEARVTPVETGALDWRGVALDLLPGEDAAGRLEAALPELARRAATMLRLVATGRLDLGGRAALEAALDRIGPDFLWVEADLGGLAIESAEADLDAIGRGGALRLAAGRLAAEMADPALSEADRRIAATALQRLHGFATEDSA